jgi:hypothetical protein
MKQLFTFILVFVCGTFFAIDSAYHNYDEIKAELDAMAALHPEFMMVDSIGVTNQENIPIWAMKVSDNVEVDEDEPALLFVGQCHAEEIQGIEIIMQHLKLISDYPQQNTIQNWLEEFELWYVPSINPEGLQIVMDEIDVTFRKNKTDANNNGTFDYNPEGWGNDLDGVDLNRNYSFNWIQGDNWHVESGDEWFDYYRGTAPFSEGGTKAIKDLASEQYFIYSINFHSSRSTKFSSSVFFPWKFKEISNRANPDFEFCEYIGESVANLIEKTGNEVGTYDIYPSKGRRGTSTPWFYQAHKTIQLTIEVTGIQPDSIFMQETVNENIKGVNWLIEQARNGYQAPCPLLTGHITDASTGEPIVAQFYLKELEKNYFEPTYSDQLYGRYWRPVGNGTYTLVVKKDGYQTFEQQVTVNNSMWTTMNVELQPLNPAQYSGRFESNGQGLAGTMIVYDVNPDTVQIVDGDFSFSTTPGTNRVEIFAENYFPVIDTVNFIAGSHSIQFETSIANTYLEENFDDISNWNVNGPWEIIDELAWEGTALTDYWGENDPQSFYAPNCDVSITSNSTFQLGNNTQKMLHFMEHLYVEPYFDFVTISVSTDQNEWIDVYSNSEIRPTWKHQYVSLNTLDAGDYYLRLRLQADSPHDDLVDPGWTIDNLKIVGGDYSITVSNDNESVPPISNRLLNNFPNPFNPETTIKFNLNINTSSSNVKIYNIKGELVTCLALNQENIKSGEIKWNAEKYASGIYFYRLSAENKLVGTQKMILLK